MALLPWHWSLGGLHERGGERKEGGGSDGDGNRQWSELSGQEEGGARIFLSSLRVIVRSIQIFVWVGCQQ